MNMNQLLKAANIAYEYSEEDKAIIRKMALEDRTGLIAALEADRWIPWVAYENCITDQPPKE